MSSFLKITNLLVPFHFKIVEFAQHKTLTFLLEPQFIFRNCLSLLLILHFYSTVPPSNLIIFQNQKISLPQIPFLHSVGTQLSPIGALNLTLNALDSH